MGRTDEPLRLIQRAHRLTWDELDLLDAATVRAFGRDVARTEGLLPDIRRPELASLTRRATEMVAQLDGYHQVLAMTAGLPQAAVDAALAHFGAQVLADPEYAMLLGPWAEVVDDDSGVLDAAFSDAADRLRSDFRWIPVEAWMAVPPADGSVLLTGSPVCIPRVSGRPAPS
jgi:hypothetical protein